MLKKLSLMMETVTVSKALETYSILAQLTAQQDFNQVICAIIMSMH
jgi:hypothetical protein